VAVDEKAKVAGSKKGGKKAARKKRR